MENMEIKVRVVSEFGRQRIQPVCDKAKLFCQIAGTKTFTDKHICAIKALGYKVTVIHDTVEL